MKRSCLAVKNTLPLLFITSCVLSLAPFSTALAASALPTHTTPYCVVRENGVAVKAGFKLPSDFVNAYLTSQLDDLLLLFANKSADELPECTFVDGRLDPGQVPYTPTETLQPPMTSVTTPSPTPSASAASAPAPQQQAATAQATSSAGSVGAPKASIMPASANGHVLGAATDMQQLALQTSPNPQNTPTTSTNNKSGGIIAGVNSGGMSSWVWAAVLAVITIGVHIPFRRRIVAYLKVRWSE